MKWYINLIFKISIILLFMACGNNSTKNNLGENNVTMENNSTENNSTIENNSTENNPTIENNDTILEDKANVIGFVQKGTFIDGNIGVYNVEENGSLSKLHINSIIDNNGSYALALKKDGLIALLAEGKFFNEFTGKNSTDKVKLYALVNFKKSDVIQTINLNLFTSLEYKRVLTLMKEGKSYIEALKSTRNSMKKEFGLEKNVQVSKLNIYDLEGTRKNENLNLLLLSSAFLKAVNEKSTTSKHSKIGAYQEKPYFDAFEKFINRFKKGQMSGAIWPMMKGYDKRKLLRRVASLLDIKVIYPKKPFVWTDITPVVIIPDDDFYDDDVIDENLQSPTPTVAPDLVDSNDSGVSSSDNITNIAKDVNFDVVCPQKDAIIRFYFNGNAYNNLYTCEGSGVERMVIPIFIDGTYTMTYTQKISEQHVESARSPSIKLTIDTMLPKVLTGIDLLKMSDTGISDTDNITSKKRPYFNIFCENNKSKVKILATYNSSEKITTEVGCQNTWTASRWTTVQFNEDFGDNEYQVTYIERDIAGNKAFAPNPIEIVIDTMAPDKPTITTPITGVDITGTAEAGTALTAHTPTSSCSTTVDASGNYSCTLTPAPINGETLEVVVEDIAGNSSPTATAVIAIDETSSPTPTVALDLQEASDSGKYHDDNITNATNLKFDVPCPKKDILIKFYVGGYLIDGRNHTCQGEGLETVLLSSFQSSGFIYRLRYKYQEAGKAESDFSPLLRLNVDRFKPEKPIIVTPITGANISGTAEADTELTAHTATSSCTTTVDSSKNYSCTLSPAPMNGETLEVVVEDIAGNVSHKATATIAMIDVSQNVLKTGVVTSILDEDDGYYKKGQDRSYAYTDNVDSHNTHTDMILDNQTGLIWQNNKNVTANDYASLSGATNWEKANSYCENLTLDAYDDWRLPSIQELLTLIDYSKQKPSLNNMFKDIEGLINHPDYHYYWSSTELASNNVFAHLIDLKTGEFHYHGKSSGDNVKCVRGNSLKEHQFAKIQEGVVKDLSTNLVWQDDEIYNSTSISDAISYCQNLHLGDIDDWRVPNMNELASILDLNKTPLNISNIFENTSKRLYYSSTHSSIDNTKYWLFGYETSAGTYSNRTQSNYKTRCVSGTNPPAVPTVKLSVLDSSDTDEDDEHIKLGIALNGTTFSDENVLLIQLTRSPDKDISASAGFVYVDETHAYIIENMENISEDITVSFTVDNSEIDYSKNITSNSIVIKKPTSNVSGDVVTVGALMWEDTAHTRDFRQSWNEANNYCSDLTLEGYSNWRLPKFEWEEPVINELGLIMSDSDSSATGGDRVINEPFALITVDDNIVSWTAENLDGSHVAGFFSGGSNNFDGMDDDSSLNVRCVRDIE